MTATVVAVPPWRGNPRAGRFSNSAQNASPRRRESGRSSTSPRRLLRGRCSRRGTCEAVGDVVGDAGVDVGRAIAAGRKNILVAEWARRSAARSRWYSASSAISGATTSRTRSPSRASSRGPNSAPRSTRCASALPTSAAEVVGQGVEGFDDDAGLGEVEDACRRELGDLDPTLVEGRRQRCAAAYASVGIAGLDATQVAVDRAPVDSAMSPEAARSRRSHASARARTLAEWASAACLCSTDMYIGSTPAI